MQKQAMDIVYLCSSILYYVCVLVIMLDAHIFCIHPLFHWLHWLMNLAVNWQSLNASAGLVHRQPTKWHAAEVNVTSVATRKLLCTESWECGKQRTGLSHHPGGMQWMFWCFIGSRHWSIYMPLLPLEFCTGLGYGNEGLDYASWELQ